MPKSEFSPARVFACARSVPGALGNKKAGPRFLDEPGTSSPSPVGVTIWTDASIQPRNPGGHLTWAFWAAQPDGKVLWESYGTVGRGAGMTNNYGEYVAVLKALRWAYGEGYRTVFLRTDSQLVFKQVTGQWSLKPDGRKQFGEIFDRILLGCEKMTVTFQWLPREENTRADELSRKPYEEAGVGA